MKMLVYGVNSDLIGPEMIDIGKTAINMFESTNSLKLVEHCLILVTMLLVKHFENIALEEVKELYRSNILLLSEDVKNFMKNILSTLENKDSVKIDLLLESFAQLKSENKITQPTIKQIILNFTNTSENIASEQNQKTESTASRTKSVSTGTMPLKEIALASGAAVVGTAFNISNNKLLKDGRFVHKDT